MNPRNWSSDTARLNLACILSLTAFPSSTPSLSVSSELTICSQHWKKSTMFYFTLCMIWKRFVTMFIWISFKMLHIFLVSEGKTFKHSYIKSSGKCSNNFAKCTAYLGPTYGSAMKYKKSKLFNQNLYAIYLKPVKQIYQTSTFQM